MRLKRHSLGNSHARGPPAGYKDVAQRLSEIYGSRGSKRKWCVEGREVEQDSDVLSASSGPSTSI